MHVSLILKAKAPLEGIQFSIFPTKRDMLFELMLNVGLGLDPGLTFFLYRPMA